MSENSQYLNSQYFTPADLEEGLLKKFLDTLIEYNLKGEYTNDIHIYEEDRAIVVEWIQAPQDKSWGGQFKFVDEDQYVLSEVFLPDGTTVFSGSEAETKELFDEWSEEHPNWYKNEKGIWIEKNE